MGRNKTVRFKEKREYTLKSRNVIPVCLWIFCVLAYPIEKLQPKPHGNRWKINNANWKFERLAWHEKDLYTIHRVKEQKVKNTKKVNKGFRGIIFKKPKENGYNESSQIIKNEIA